MSVCSKPLFTIATLAWTLSIGGLGFAGDVPFARRLSVISTAISDERLESISTEDIAIRSDSAFQLGSIICLMPRLRLCRRSASRGSNAGPTRSRVISEAGLISRACLVSNLACP
jgi:hypothetical protein